MMKDTLFIVVASAAFFALGAVVGYEMHALPIAGMQSLTAEAAKFGWRCGAFGSPEAECVESVGRVISGKIE